LKVIVEAIIRAVAHIGGKKESDRKMQRSQLLNSEHLSLESLDWNALPEKERKGCRETYDFSFCRDKCQKAYTAKGPTTAPLPLWGAVAGRRSGVKVGRTQRSCDVTRGPVFSLRPRFANALAPSLTRSWSDVPMSSCSASGVLGLLASISFLCNM
jgi:hypothetical protein